MGFEGFLVIVPDVLLPPPRSENRGSVLGFEEECNFLVIVPDMLLPPLAQKTDGTREAMHSFLHDYLKRRFSLEQMVVEWGYNLHDACQRYAHDDTIGLFWKVLIEEVRSFIPSSLCP